MHCATFKYIEVILRLFLFLNINKNSLNPIWYFERNLILHKQHYVFIVPKGKWVNLDIYAYAFCIIYIEWSVQIKPCNIQPQGVFYSISGARRNVPQFESGLPHWRCFCCQLNRTHQRFLFQYEHGISEWSIKRQYFISEFNAHNVIKYRFSITFMELRFCKWCIDSVQLFFLQKNIL